MTNLELLALIAIFLITSVISVITGSTSLVTVPVMLQFGIEPRTALATNMLALMFMSVGATLPFVGKGVIDYQRLPSLLVLTLTSSIVGALLVLFIPSKSIPLIVSISMIVVAALSVANRNAGVETSQRIPSQTREIFGYIATFILGIYGGFFSGGYVTLLTAAYVMLFRMTFVQAIATSKFVNIFSSLSATLIFMVQGIVDYRLGAILGLSMFIGGVIGARISLRLSNLWLQRIYLTVVGILAFVTLRKSLQEDHSNSYEVHNT
ncbi:sulfite exporter TauE/SafE family protein [Aetokthonos hydrillicola Thurmond2011]|uniref:Probable membrane transporter protein n=1 Tax=Aetokthonos hydrillicola Thurmond2011 TaxID=2712845 RepID=A0AAP5I8F8_9CYAN|nr:sulfite exporter TauE/SafE family protein [Aetokthonos hydrillicola]MBO3462557.1 sulfite exporter TauE/SafE family protein [Aetokthonos hydrillicola CCALA 1050]MBW4590345.1 sulfite exporter TauE/SafE family protein [Aetokthonos hydrillicola CCALA 1050]MDR9896887.1 sulfite exporter TauE/SafE family protein [Aetokthonos hydrillicola Thurmond2011]